MASFFWGALQLAIIFGFMALTLEWLDYKPGKDGTLGAVVAVGFALAYVVTLGLAYVVTLGLQWIMDFVCAIRRDGFQSSQAEHSSLPPSDDRPAMPPMPDYRNKLARDATGPAVPRSRALPPSSIQRQG